MREEKRQALLQREAILILLIQWHTENKDSIWENAKDYEEFINSALDELFIVQKTLKEDKPESL